MKNIILLVLASVAISSCSSTPSRAPAQEAATGLQGRSFPSDSYAFSERPINVSAREMKVWISEDDARNCGFSMRAGEHPGHFQCELHNPILPPNSATVLKSPTATFELYRGIGEDAITVHLLADRVRVEITARNLQAAADLLRDHFKANMHKLRMVKYAVINPGN